MKRTEVFIRLTTSSVWKWQCLSISASSAAIVNPSVEKISTAAEEAAPSRPLAGGRGSDMATLGWLQRRR